MTIALAAVVLHAEILMPGTQPLEGDIAFGKVDQCVMCHGNTSNGAADPFFSWQGGMMAQAARDPVFRAALAIANQDVPDVGEFCIRCHSPGGWLADRSKVADASALTREDLHGVSCEPCHHLVDPLSDEAKTLAAAMPPGYGNGMMVADPANVVRGPYGESPAARPHGVKRSDYHASSQLCATCHDVSNPLQAEDVKTQPPYAFSPIERTYSEWALSDFAQMGAEGTCQSCHYPRVAEGGQPSRFSDVRRDYFVQHGPVGGSTWVQDVTYELWDGRDMSNKALDAGKERARALLRTAAALKLTQPDANTLRLRITNLTGHKLPTGYPEGRRMWINLIFQDAQGRVIEERGRYGNASETLWDKPVQVPTLLDPEDTRVYECLPGISAEQAKKHDVPEGASFHFVLNDVMVKDNRIPPKGFTLAAFTEHRCQPIGADYADGQNWDEMDLKLPPGTATVQVRLMYQSVSWEYIKFLAEENTSDDWGKRLYESWTKTDQCPPTVMAEAQLAIAAGP